MKFATTIVLAGSLGLSIAAPAVESRQFQALLHFFGAAGTEYTISAPTSGTDPFTTGKTHSDPSIYLS